MLWLRFSCAGAFYDALVAAACGRYPAVRALAACSMPASHYGSTLLVTGSWQAPVHVAQVLLDAGASKLQACRPVRPALPAHCAAASN